MKIVNIHHAKTHLSKLLEEVKNGEEVVLAKYGKPIADLIPHKPKKNKIKFGVAKGKFKYKDEDLMGVDPDIQKMFYGDDWEDVS